MKEADYIVMLFQMKAFVRFMGLGPAHFLRRAIDEIERLQAENLVLTKKLNQLPRGKNALKQN